MASKSAQQEFQSQWNQTASWAQSKGIKYNAYYPIYQQDSQRLAAGQSPMSSSERERAVIAAGNIGKTTQATPSTAAKPGNVVGNTMTDLRSIFTGIGGVFIHPLHNGLVDSVKNTFDDVTGPSRLKAGGNFGADLGNALTGTVLSWVPGAADIGTVLAAEYGPGHDKGWQGSSGNPGLDALAEHPVGSVLDVLPVAKPLAAADSAADASRLGAASARGATRVGMSVDQAQDATIGRVIKGYVMNTMTDKTGPTARLNGGIDTMTLGDRLHALTGKGILNANPAIADAAQGLEKTTSLDTASERYQFNDVENATKDFSPEQTQQLSDVMNPAQNDGMNLEQRVLNPDLDPRVVQATRAIVNGPLRYINEMSLAAKKGVQIITDPWTGVKRMYSSIGHKAVIKARDKMTHATDKALEQVDVLEKMHQQTVLGQHLFDQGTERVEAALEAARKVRPDGVATIQNVGDKMPISLSKARLANRLLGENGIVESMLNQAKGGNYENVVELTKAVISRLDKWAPENIDASADPAYQKLQQEVVALNKSAQILRHLRKKADRAVYGAGKEWKGEKENRDATHAEAKKVHKAAQAHENAVVRKTETRTRNQLDSAFRVKKNEIRSRYAKAKAQRAATLKAGMEEIDERFALEGMKSDNRHLMARETKAEWMRGRRAQGLPASNEYIQSAQDGTRSAPGTIGTPEAMAADRASLTAARKAEVEALEKSLPTVESLNLKMNGELKAADLMKAKMRERVDTQFDAHRRTTAARHQVEDKEFKAEQIGKKAREGETSQVFRDYNKAQKEFQKAVWDKPSDNFAPLYFNIFAKHLLVSEDVQRALSVDDKALADAQGWGEEHIQELRANPQTLSQLTQLGIEGVYDHPIFNDIDPAVIKSVHDSAMTELNELARQGIFPQYIPNVSGTVNEDGIMQYGVHVTLGKAVKAPDALKARTWGMASSKYDLMAGIHRGVKQVLDQAATKDYIEKYLSPRVSTSTDLMNRLIEMHPEIKSLADEPVLSFFQDKMKEWNLVKFDPKSQFGVSMPRWGKDATYIDKDLLKAVERLTANHQLPTGAIYDKATKLFRYSILGLSPRYTAHIVFGGTFLLALRSTPWMPLYLGDALKMMKTGADRPEDLLTRVPTNMGTTDIEIRSPHQAVQKFNEAAGKQSVKMMIHEHMEKVQGIARGEEGPIHYIKALADLNLHFTAYVSNLQRTLAYLDGAHKAERAQSFVDENGERVAMTKERMQAEGMHHAEQVMGDLRRMSPFERQVARSVVPFYGWEKHILQYVLSFPGDHPWRAMMLANMAEYDTEHTPNGLPSRYQFLFYLGTPDAQGNVTAIDARAANPLRDVANYATLGGVVSSLNPVISSGLSYIDPSIIYGGNELHPNLTYDQFYGIEEAGPQGNVVDALSGIVPQIGALKTAMQTMTTTRGLTGEALAKSIGESLNVPWVPEKINLKQEAARTAMSQYQVVSSLANNAWETGDFSQIKDLGSVPDPRNSQYETPVSELEKLYAQLAAEYPGVPPDQSAMSLPSAHI